MLRRNVSEDSFDPRWVTQQQMGVTMKAWMAIAAPFSISENPPLTAAYMCLWTNEHVKEESNCELFLLPKASLGACFPLQGWQKDKNFFTHYDININTIMQNDFDIGW